MFVWGKNTMKLPLFEEFLENGILKKKKKTFIEHRKRHTCTFYVQAAIVNCGFTNYFGLLTLYSVSNMFGHYYGRIISLMGGTMLRN